MHLFPKVASPSAAKSAVCMTLVVSALVVSMSSSIAEHKNIPSNNKQQMTSQKNDVSAEVTKTLQAQAEAWNAGDLDKFMSSYLKSPNITFVSADVR